MSKVLFISYSHDSAEHKSWVKKFAVDLAVRGGFEVLLDQHLADVFPYLDAANIQRGFNSRGGYTDRNANASIIHDIMGEFEDVAEIAGIEVKNVN